MAFWVAGIRSARSWRHSPRPAGGCWAGARQQGGQPSHRYWVVLSIVPSTWASAAFIRVEARAELPHRHQQEQDAQGLAQIARRTVLTGPLGPAMAKTTAPTMPKRVSRPSTNAGPLTLARRLVSTSTTAAESANPTTAT